MYNNDVGQESAQKFMKQTGALTHTHTHTHTHQMAGTVEFDTLGKPTPIL
jgi:hypothetical protein